MVGCHEVIAIIDTALIGHASKLFDLLPETPVKFLSSLKQIIITAEILTMMKMDHGAIRRIREFDGNIAKSRLVQARR